MTNLKKKKKKKMPLPLYIYSANKKQEKQTSKQAKSPHKVNNVFHWPYTFLFDSYAIYKPPHIFELLEKNYKP